MPLQNKNTKIVCTLGPASDSVKEISALIKAGMNVARLNFSHGTYEHHAKIIKNIHKAEEETGTTIGILQDLQGPKLRLGILPERGIKLKENQRVIIHQKTIEGYCDKDNLVHICSRYKGLVKDCKKNDVILIDDGLVELKVIEAEKSQLICQVKTSGQINSGNGIHLPTASTSLPTITKKDREDLAFGLKNNVDFIALSFVKNKKDIEELRKLIKKAGKETPIIAKIERHEAVKNLASIVRSADGVMVARGDLGVDIPAEQVPIIQKRIIHLANKYGKPVITATQVLYSMIKKARATRAEISDAANAVYDHTDAIMLSNETTTGKYPVRATQTLSKVALAVEKEIKKHEELIEYFDSKHKLSPINAACLNACELAHDSKADYLINYTSDGYTTNALAKHRPHTPIITITSNKKTARKLTIVWGINKIYIQKLDSKNKEEGKPKYDKLQSLLHYIRKEKIVPKGKKVVVICNASRKEELIATVRI